VHLELQSVMFGEGPFTRPSPGTSSPKKPNWEYPAGQDLTHVTCPFSSPIGAALMMAVYSRIQTEDPLSSKPKHSRFILQSSFAENAPSAMSVGEAPGASGLYCVTYFLPTSPSCVNPYSSGQAADVQSGHIVRATAAAKTTSGGHVTSRMACNVQLQHLA